MDSGSPSAPVSSVISKLPIPTLYPFALHSLTLPPHHPPPSSIMYQAPRNPRANCSVTVQVVKPPSAAPNGAPAPSNGAAAAAAAAAVGGAAGGGATGDEPECPVTVAVVLQNPQASSRTLLLLLPSLFQPLPPVSLPHTSLSSPHPHTFPPPAGHLPPHLPRQRPLRSEQSARATDRRPPGGHGSLAGLQAAPGPGHEQAAASSTWAAPTKAHHHDTGTGIQGTSAQHLLASHARAPHSALSHITHIALHHPSSPLHPHSSAMPKSSSPRPQTARRAPSSTAWTREPSGFRSACCS